jgi:hypothetical protein
VGRMTLLAAQLPLLTRQRRAGCLPKWAWPPALLEPPTIRTIGGSPGDSDDEHYGAGRRSHRCRSRTVLVMLGARDC